MMSHRKTMPMRPRISRRHFLGSAATVVSLPFLESLFSRSARAQECQGRQRFIAFFVPNGIHMPDFTPTATGRDWPMPYILEPLAPIRNKIAVITGIDYQRTAEPGEPPGGHGSGTGAFLTMMPVHQNYDNPGRISLDQKIAKETVACNRPLPSLQLGLSVRGDGNDRLENAAHINTISWDANRPLPFSDNPAEVFDRIFAGFEPDASDADAARRAALRTSVLDHVLGEAETLKLQLGSEDRQKLDSYMTSVRELETRIRNLGGGDVTGACSVPARPTETDASAYPDRVRATLDLAALAFQCDVTRVISFMFGRGNSMQDFAFLFDGEGTEHHLTSHHAGNANQQRKLREISRWEVEHVADFLLKLEQTSEGEGQTVLDNTLAYFNSEISDGDRHRKYDMPIFLAGGAGGGLRIDGSHHMYTNMSFPRPLVGPSGGPHGIQLFVSILRGFGLPDDTFGDGSASGPLGELLV